MAAEGYCVMQYQCQKQSCGIIEKLYNSRNGVTPFIISCKDCGGEMQHIKWHEDVHDPSYIPKPGQRVFFSMPIELAQIFVRRNLKKWETSDHPPPTEGTPEREGLYESLIEDYYRDGEAPCIYIMP